MREGRDGRSWTEWAACRDVDTEIFFPVGDRGPALQQIEQAKAVCAHCPVLDACLDEAVRTRQAHGIWGGQTPEERQAGERYRQRARQSRPGDEDRIAS